MPNTPRGLCPRCHARELVEHCASKTCRWNRCLNRECKAVFDLGRRFGFRVHPDPKQPQENLVLGGI